MMGEKPRFYHSCGDTPSCVVFILRMILLLSIQIGTFHKIAMHMHNNTLYIGRYLE